MSCISMVATVTMVFFGSYHSWSFAINAKLVYDVSEFLQITIYIYIIVIYSHKPAVDILVLYFLQIYIYI